MVQWPARHRRMCRGMPGLSGLSPAVWRRRRGRPRRHLERCGPPPHRGRRSAARGPSAARRRWATVRDQLAVSAGFAFRSRFRHGGKMLHLCGRNGHSCCLHQFRHLGLAVPCMHSLLLGQSWHSLRRRRGQHRLSPAAVAPSHASPATKLRPAPSSTELGRTRGGEYPMMRLARDRGARTAHTAVPTPSHNCRDHRGSPSVTSTSMTMGQPGHGKQGRQLA